MCMFMCAEYTYCMAVAAANAKTLINNCQLREWGGGVRHSGAKSVTNGVQVQGGTKESSKESEELSSELYSLYPPFRKANETWQYKIL